MRDMEDSFGYPPIKYFAFVRERRALLEMCNFLYRMWFGLMLCCVSTFAYVPSVHAYRTPEYTYNLGGLPISCSIYSDQASLAGIHADDPLQKVTAIFGKPKSSYKATYNYIDKGLTISFVDWDGNGKYTVVDMEATKSGVATLDGVKVGMPESILSKVYGTADEVYIEKKSSPKLSAEQMEKIHKRFGSLIKTTYTYYANPCLTMSFVVGDGLIQKIHIHRSD